MRAPLQVLALPYRWTDSDLEFCIFLRRRHDTWQFISGGGEDDETPLETVKREVEEERWKNGGHRGAPPHPCSHVCMSSFFLLSYGIFVFA